jgi:NAD+ kinase
MENAEAIVVVPVCSSTGQRPLVLPAGSAISITEVESRLGRDLVLDGQERVRVHSKGFTIQASPEPVRFVRFGKARYLQVFGKLDARHHGTELPSRAPPSVRFVYRLLEDEGSLTEKQLIAESRMPERTVRNAISYLVRAGLVRRDTSLRDARETVFTLRR